MKVVRVSDSPILDPGAEDGLHLIGEPLRSLEISRSTTENDHVVTISGV
jgi:hypothetical protein